MPSTAASAARRSRRLEPAGPRLAIRVQEHRQRLLGVAHEERVEEVGDRLGVRRAGPASEDDRIGLAAVALPHRQPREVQHVEDVRVVELRLEREAQDVEVRDGRERLRREERNPVLAHPRLEIHPRRIDPLAGEVLPPVDDLVEDLQPRVAHPDLVGVGESQRQRHRGLREVLPRDVALEADVAARLLDERQMRVEERPQGAVSHGTGDSTGDRRPRLLRSV